MTGRRKNHEIEWITTALQLIALVVVAWMIFVETRQVVRDFAVLGAVLLSFTGVAFMSVRRDQKTNLSKNSASAQAAKPCLTLARTSTQSGVTVAALHRVRPAHAAAENAEPPVSHEFLKKLHSMDWSEFEMIVETLFRDLGYRIIRRGTGHHDIGIDLVIERDGQRAGVQCKHWKTADVRIRSMREFLDALAHAGIQQGVFITLHGFTHEARQLAEQHHVEILNESRLADLLKQNDPRFHCHPVGTPAE